MSNKYDTEFNAQQRHADYIRKAVDALQGAPVPTEGRSDLAAPSDEPFSDFWDDAKVADQPEDAALRDKLGDVLRSGQYGYSDYATAEKIMQLFHAQQAKAVQAARIDENDIWQAHSTARRLNDNEPAIRTVDFKDRIAELQPTQPPAADTTKQGEGE